MRITTSYHSSKACIHNWDSHEQEWHEFTPERHHAQCSWTWLLTDAKDANPPKSWKSLVKHSPKQYLRQGLSSGHIVLRLAVKPEKGKVWTSRPLSLTDIPDELVKALSDRNQKKPAFSSAKWTGPFVDIFTPMHQRHPGLAEHAAMACLDVNGRLVAFLSDTSDPMMAPVWHAYELLAAERAAIPVMESCERAKQKELLLALPGELVELRCGTGVRLSDEHFLERLAGVRKFAWTLDRNIVPPIHAMARKFKLGESITESERKAISGDELSSLLDRLCGSSVK